MEVKEKKEIVEKENNTIKSNNKNKVLIFGILTVIALVVVVLTITNKKGNIEIKAKSKLDKVVEKIDLETATFNYNVIAKQCKKDEKCNKESNNIDDFEYVVSCTGTVTAGIKDKIPKVEVDKKNKKLIIEVPEAEVTEVNVGSLKFLNGEDIPAIEFPNARKLCQDTIEEKSKKDENLIPAAKEQAEVVLKSFYEQWIKAIDKEYKVEVK